MVVAREQKGLRFSATAVGSVVLLAWLMNWITTYNSLASEHPTMSTSMDSKVPPSTKQPQVQDLVYWMRETQVFAAFCSYIGIIMCWQGLIWATSSWWVQPCNCRAMSARLNRMLQDGDGAVDYSSFLADHPATISALIGDVGTAQGSIFKALALPALILVLIGNIFIYGTGVDSSHTTSFMSVYTAIAVPIGFLLVLFTPIKTLDRTTDILDTDGDGVVQKHEERALSDLEKSYQDEWCSIHVIGFVIAIVLPMFTAPVAPCYHLWYYFMYPEAPPDQNWHWLSRLAYVVLLSLRLLAAVLQFPAAIRFLCCEQIHRSLVPVGQQNVCDFNKFRYEYCVLLLAMCPCLFDSVIMLVSKHTAPRSFVDGLFVSTFVLYTIFCFSKHVVKIAFIDPYRNSTEAAWHEIIYHETSNRHGPLHRRFAERVKETSTNPLLAHLRVVQAGGPDDKLLGIMGPDHPKARLLLIKPNHYVEMGSLEIHQIEPSARLFFNRSLALMLKELPSADTLFFPFGTGMKCGQRSPLLRLSCTQFSQDLACIDPKSLTATMSFSEWPAYNADGKLMQGKFASETEIAFDVTAKVLHMLPMLKQTSFVELLEQSDCGDIYDAFAGIMGNKIYPPYQLFMETPIPSAASYEIQVRGIKSAPPRAVVIRLPKEHQSALPTDWCSKITKDLFPTES